ncbi:MAG: copper resistance protein CopC [Thaumarchaeota archaeon]|nr:copper resistance protein CopC [Nitrososphaerota archaeon]
MTKKKSIPLLALALLACFVVALAPNMPHSYGHALVIASNPTNGQSLSSSPGSVSATFSDPIDIHYSKIKVLDSNGKEIDNKDDHFVGTNQEVLSVTLPSSIPNGVYTASWKVLDQTDGHVTEGAFVFGVGEAVPQKTSATTAVSIYDIISIPFVVARFPALLGEVIIVGSSFLSLWMWKPIAMIPWLSQVMSRTRIHIEKQTAMIILIGAAILFVANIAMIVAEAVSINASLSDAILTKFGQSWILRMTLSGALIVIAYTWYHTQKNSNIVSTNSWKWAIFGLGIGILATESLISHAAATGLSLPPVLDFVHDVAASFWIGGLVYGAFVVLPALKRSEDHFLKLAVISFMIPRFTLLVIAVLGVVAVTGPTLLYTLETSLSLTLASVYGQILIVKLSLAAGMIAMGGYHEIATRSKAFAKVKSISTQASGTQIDLAEVKRLESRFHSNILIEALIGIVLLASVSVLVDSGLPPTQFQNQLQQISPSAAFAVAENTNTYTETAYAQNGTRVLLTIDPYYAGSNNLKISFLDTHGNLIPMDSVRLTYTQVDKGIGPIVENANPVSQGTFSVDTNTFAIAGHWNMQIEGVQSAANSLNIIGIYKDLYLTPRIDTISASIKEYKLPQNDSRPLFAVYDKIRNTVWVGDAQIKSGRLYSFDLDSKSFKEHNLQGINDVTLMGLNNLDDTLWYIDPISKLLCNYNPDTNANQIYHVPVQQGSILSGLAIDNSDNVWISVSSLSNINQILKFDSSKKTFTTIPLASGSVPLGLAIDDTTGDIWIAESGLGKIGKINPSDNTITEYPSGNGTLATPTVILIDSLTERIYVSEHDGRQVSAFDPILKTFSKYPLDQNQQNLPYGMVFDMNHDLWVAQHTLDKISMINPRTGETNEFPIPSTSSLTQYITTDSQGDIILVEQGADALGILTTTSGLPTSKSSSSSLPFEYPGVGLGVVAGPAIAASIIALSFFYVKSSKDMNETSKWIHKLGNFKKSVSPI